MKATAIEIEEKVNELLVILDKDIQHIQQSLSRLDELRSLVVKRDEAALGKLLKSIQAESSSYTSNELKRQSIRKELAIAFGCEPKQMTLSRLEATLPEEKKGQVAQRKTKLRALTEELKKEHLSTVLLLSECSRFNSLLLKSILGLGKTGSITYNSDGRTKRQTDTAFVNLQF